MLIDMGTNTEVVLHHRGRMYAASCPAGPAFEGGLVTYGMRAYDGAIESIRLAADGSAGRLRPPSAAPPPPGYAAPASPTCWPSSAGATS